MVCCRPAVAVRTGRLGPTEARRPSVAAPDSAPGIVNAGDHARETQRQSNQPRRGPGIRRSKPILRSYYPVNEYIDPSVTLDRCIALGRLRKFFALDIRNLTDTEPLQVNALNPKSPKPSHCGLFFSDDTTLRSRPSRYSVYVEPTRKCFSVVTNETPHNLASA